MRVYAEPSHTLLGAVVSDDPSIASDPSLEADLAMDTAAPVQRMALQPNARAVLQTLAPPQSDRTVRVTINGVWAEEDGITRDREASIRVTTRLSHFAFAYSRVLRADDSPRAREEFRDRRSVHYKPRIIALGEVCCGQGGGSCQRNCTTCSGEDYNCCWETDSACGWCGKVVAGCSATQCPGC